MTSVPASDRFNEALRELAAVQAALAELGDDEFTRRQDLKDIEAARRAELRDLSRQWTDHLSIDQLRHRIADAERRLGEHYGNRLSHTAGGQSGFGGGLDPTILHRMHRAMDATADLAGMKADLARLKDRLAKLEGM